MISAADLDPDVFDVVLIGHKAPRRRKPLPVKGWKQARTAGASWAEVVAVLRAVDTWNAEVPFAVLLLTAPTPRARSYEGPVLAGTDSFNARYGPAIQRYAALRADGQPHEAALSAGTNDRTNMKVYADLRVDGHGRTAALSLSMDSRTDIRRYHAARASGLSRSRALGHANAQPAEEWLPRGTANPVDRYRDPGTGLVWLRAGDAKETRSASPYRVTAVIARSAYERRHGLPASVIGRWHLAGVMEHLGYTEVDAQRVAS